MHKLLQKFGPIVVRYLLSVLTIAPQWITQRRTSGSVDKIPMNQTEARKSDLKRFYLASIVMSLGKFCLGVFCRSISVGLCFEMLAFTFRKTELHCFEAAGVVKRSLKACSKKLLLQIKMYSFCKTHMFIIMKLLVAYGNIKPYICSWYKLKNKYSSLLLTVFPLIVR